MTNESGRINKSIILRYYDKYEYPYYSELFPKLLALCTSTSARTKKGAAPLLTFNFCGTAINHILIKLRNDTMTKNFFLFAKLFKT